ncbi:MAG: ubiquinone biosynthesis protein UbiB, partial [Tsuneonella sp.]
VMVEGIATQLDPAINMWDVSAPFVRDWIRDELGPEAALAERIRRDTQTLLRVPDLIRRIEDMFPPRGGAPEEPPLPYIPLMWERVERTGVHWMHLILGAILGAGVVAGAIAGGWIG